MEIYGPAQDVEAVEMWMPLSTDMSVGSAALLTLLDIVSPDWAERDSWLDRAIGDLEQQDEVVERHWDRLYTLRSVAFPKSLFFSVEGVQEEGAPSSQQCLRGSELLGRMSTKRVIVMGDFNQTTGPGSRARLELRLALRKAFPPSMTIATATLAFQERRSIDHIALSEHLAVGPPIAPCVPTYDQPQSVNRTREYISR